MPYADFVASMDKARQTIASRPILHKGVEANVTISVGMADAKSENIDCMWNLYRHSDAKLYEAKNAGKNQIKS